MEAAQPARHKGWRCHAVLNDALQLKAVNSIAWKYALNSFLTLNCPTELTSLWAFHNIIQFSCSRPTNQIAVFSRLNWIIL